MGSVGEADGEVWSGRGRGLVLVGLVVGVAVLPIVLAALAVVGDPWVPIGDWASAVVRTGQVGTTSTPLIGAYSTKGWAHPGPLPFWLAAPAYRLSGEDARALLWTAALVNVASVVVLARVAWRRGGWPLLAGTMLLVALVIHGLGAQRLVDMWNPYVPLLPFLLTIFLVWDAGLGRSRALVEAAVPASFAAQSHVAFVSLVAVLVVWLVVWRRLRGAAPEGEEAEEDDDAGVWRRRVRQALAVTAVLWIGPVIDLVAGVRNPFSVAGSFTDGDGRMGMGYAFGLLSRYVRPDGPWLGGPEPTVLASVQGTGVVWLVLVVAGLVGCVNVARRVGLVDVEALATLTLALLAGALPAIAAFEFPANTWLTQWVKVVGGLVWFTFGWTGWRLVAPTLRSTAASAPAPSSGSAPSPVWGRRPVAVATGVVLVVASAWSWRTATSVDPPYSSDGAQLGRLQAELDGALPADRAYRLEASGDLGSQMLGVVGWLVDQGYDVVTSDGADGLKWGEAHRYAEGDDVDVFLTLAVHEVGYPEDAYADCLGSSDAELVAGVDDLSDRERRWLEDLRLRRLADPESVTRSDRERATRLEKEDFRAGIFAGTEICSDVIQPSGPDSDPDPREG